MARVFSTVVAGADAADAWRSAIADAIDWVSRPSGADMATTTAVDHLDLPTELDPDRLGTWLRRAAAAAGGEPPEEVPEEAREIVGEVLRRLQRDPATCVALPLAGDAARRSRRRLALGDADERRPWLLVGLRT